MIIKNKTKQGIAPLLLVLIIAVISGGAGAIYLKTTNKPISIESARENILGIQKEETLESIKIDTEGINFSLTSIPTLEVPMLNIEVPNLSLPKISNLNASLIVDVPIQNDLISIDSPSLDNIKPKISIPANIKIPATNIPASNVPVAPTTGTENPPPAGSKDGQGINPSEGLSPQVDCGIFQAAPSCSYVGAPGSQGYEACKQCFPNK